MSGNTYLAASDASGADLYDGDISQAMFFSAYLDEATRQAMFDAPKEGLFMTDSKTT